MTDADAKHLETEQVHLTESKYDYTAAAAESPVTTAGESGSSAASGTPARMVLSPEVLNTPHSKLHPGVTDHVPAPGACCTVWWKKHPSCCTSFACCARYLRHKVSQNKRRYQDSGYDLDLTYLTDNIIVMGFPSTGVEHLWRNSRPEVIRFFEERHAGHHRVFNLCDEDGRLYANELFHETVCYPFRDHGVPPLPLLLRICNDAAAYIARDPKNVVAIHCKAGKGRSGVVGCCLLLKMGIAKTSKEAMALYDKQRTYDGKGLTVPSQQRFVHYFGAMMERERRGLDPIIPEPTRRLDKVVLTGKVISPKPLQLFVCEGPQYIEVLRTKPAVGQSIPAGVEVTGNVMIIVKQGKKKVVMLCMNTAFIPGDMLRIVKDDIDSLKTDPRNRVTSADFACELHFGPLPPS